MSRPSQVDANELRTSASVGIAIYPSDGEDHDALLRNADRAMYSAKQRGRDNFQFYSPSLPAS